MKTSKKYTRELFRQFRYLAAWLPGTPFALGDIGILNGKQYTKIGNLGDEKYKIKFEIEEDTTPGDINHQSKGAVTVSAKISGAAKLTNSTLEELEAGFNVSFSKENAIFFKAKGTYNHSIKDQIKLGDQILQLYKDGKWDKDYVVITELVKADSSTILISSQKNSSIDIKANASLGNKTLDIADASLELGAKFSKGISTELICAAGLTPLFKVSKVKTRFLGSPIFEVAKVRSNKLMQKEYNVLDNPANYFGPLEIDDFDDVEAEE